MTELIRPSTVALTYPGQGGSSRGLLADLERQSPAARAVLARVRAAWAAETGDDVAVADLDADPGSAAADDRAFARSQVAIFATSLAMHAVLSGSLPDPVVHVGHSFGEIAALTAAGAWSVEDGTRVVAARTRSLAAVGGGVGGMSAVSGAAAQVAHLVAAVADDRLRVAGDNGPGQVVVSGPLGSLERLEAAAATLGVPTVRLRSAFPFHSPMMEPVVAGFAEAVRRIGWTAPRQPVYSPIVGRFYREDDDLSALLAAQLVEPFDFGAAVRAVHAQGVRLLVECGGRTALTAAVRRTLSAEGGPAGWQAVACHDGAAEPAAEARRALAGHGVPNGHAAPAVPADLMTVLRELLRTELESSMHRLVTELRAGVDRPGPVTAPPEVTDTPVEQEQELDQELESELEPEPAATGELDPETVMAGLVELYAQALEYPPEVLERDVELEGDLGVDSVKQTELLARAADRFGLPMQPSDFVIGDYPTLGHIADLVVSSPSVGQR